MTSPDLMLDSDVLIEIGGRPETGRWLTDQGSQTVGISVLTREEWNNDWRTRK